MKRPSVLVTGGTRRLGKAVADRLERGGWRVVRSSHRPGAGADITADLSREGGADGLFSDACALLGGAPDAIVNNAALFRGGDDVLEMLNLRSPARLVELAERAGSESVVNILDSRVMRSGFRPADAYEASKRALLALTVAPHGRLRVNGVAPGPVLAPESVREKAGECPLGRRPEPEDVAEAVAFLLSARSTTGCVIPVDGGQSRGGILFSFSSQPQPVF